MFDLEYMSDNDFSEEESVADSQEDIEETEDAIDAEESEDVSESVEEEVAPSKKQSKDTDAAFAKMRREAEQYKAQLQERDAWIAQQFKDYGISSWEEYKSKMEMQIQEQRQAEVKEREEALREAGYDPDIIKQIIEPELNAIKQENEQLKQAIQQEQQDKKLLNDYNELRKEFPDFVKRPEDIPPEVWQKYEEGYSLVDAFTTVNRKEILNKTKDSARQKTLNSLNSKQHLRTEGAGGEPGEDSHMPNSVLEMYMEMGMSKKEAHAHYKKLYK